jgi:hypothetical protein
LGKLRILNARLGVYDCNLHRINACLLRHSFNDLDGLLSVYQNETYCVGQRLAVDQGRKIQ